MFSRSQIILLISILLLIITMAGMAISDYIFTNSGLKIVAGTTNHAIIQSGYNATLLTKIDTALQAQQPNTDSVFVPSNSLSGTENSKIIISTKIASSSMPLFQKDQASAQISNKETKILATQAASPEFNSIPKNSFREIDRSSQTVHSTLSLSKVTNTPVKPVYNNYNSEDSIGPDGRVVLDGDEYTLNPKPLKRRGNNTNNNTYRGSTYTYYRASATENASVKSAEQAAPIALEPIVSFLGTLLSGKANGYGVGVYANGNSYKGNWKDNAKEGYGIYSWKNGEEFRGNYKNNLRNGYGKMYNRLGQLIQEGYWEHDQYVK